MGRNRLLAAALLISLLGAACPDEATAESGDATLTEQDKRLLVDLARQTLSWWVTENKPPELPKGKLRGALKANLGCFVTLEKQGLRGCIGMFDPSTSLASNVVSRAVAASTHDHRFPPVKPEELSEIHVEISVLTAPKPLPYKNPQDLLTKLVPLEHGVILKTRKGSSTYLPQVWEQLPDKEQFLSRLCFKHGALATCWRDGPERTQVEIYEAIVFGEDTHGRVVVGSSGASVGSGGAVYSAASPIDTLAGKRAPFERGARLKPGTRLLPGTILAPGADLAK